LVIVFLVTQSLVLGTSDAATNTVLNLKDGLTSGTLRSALAKSAAGDTIIFGNGLAGTISLTSGQLLINKDLTNLFANNWVSVSNVPAILGNQRCLTNTLPGGSRFFQLH
jgi:hypothetical protein